MSSLVPPTLLSNRIGDSIHRPFSVEDCQCGEAMKAKMIHQASLHESLEFGLIKDSRPFKRKEVVFGEEHLTLRARQYPRPRMQELLDHP